MILEAQEILAQLFFIELIGRRTVECAAVAPQPAIRHPVCKRRAGEAADCALSATDLFVVLEDVDEAANAQYVSVRINF